MWIALTGSAAEDEAWTVGRTDVPLVTGAHSIAFGHGRFVATVGGAGAPGVVWSEDGVSWRAALRPPPPGGAVIFVGGTFYHAGDGGLARSTDGDTWARLYTTPGRSFFREMASDGRSLMVVEPNLNSKTLLFGPNFTNWRETAPLPYSDEGNVLFYNLVYAFGRYFLSYDIQRPGLVTLTHHVVSTFDGSAWQLMGVPLSDARMLAAGNGHLVGYGWAAGASFMVISADGTTFRTAPLPNGIMNGGALAFAGGRFFSTGTLQATGDGVAWAPLAEASLPQIRNMRGIAFGANRYVAVGYGIGTDVIATLVASAPPLITRAPRAQSIAAGDRLVLRVALENPTPDTTWQWLFNGRPVPGATDDRLTLDPVRYADTGAYRIEVRNPAGVSSIEPVAIVVVAPADDSRLVNLSVITPIDEPGESEPALTLGFVVGGRAGTGKIPLMVRVAGPALAQFGVRSPHPDPRLELLSAGRLIAENDNWGGDAAVAATSAQLGAFPFGSADSHDAAVLSPGTPYGDASVKVFGTNGATGTVLAEVYDNTPTATLTATMPRLANVSVLERIPAGSTLAAGFVLSGITGRTLVIRAVGPTLGGFGVADALANPRLAVYRVGTATVVAGNDDWNNAAELADAFRTVGAFPLNEDSRDAALLLEADPGAYLVLAGSADPTSGSVLLEIYELRQ